MSKTPQGYKSYKEGKLVAEEVLPNRMAKATITGGDIYQRMSGHYGKKNNSSQPSGPMLPMMMGRF